MVKGGKMRDNRHKLKEERFRIYGKIYGKKTFPHEASQAVRQDTQRSCAISIFRGFQNVAG